MNSSVRISNIMSETEGNQCKVISESMLEICMDMINIALNSVHKLPNTYAEFSDPSSAIYSINYILRLLQVVFLKAKTEERKCPQNVINSTYVLLSKAERDLLNQFAEVSDIESVAYSIHTCICTVKNYLVQLKTSDPISDMTS